MTNWGTAKLSTLCRRIGDGLHGTPSYVDNGNIYFINGNNLRSGKIIIDFDTKQVSQQELENNFVPLDENSLLLGINGTLGNMAFYNGENIMLGKSSAYLNFKSDINKFYYYYFQLPGVQKYFYDVATGSTIKNLSLKSLQDFEVPVPSKSEYRKIAAVLSALDDKIELNNKINAELEAMAKTLYDYWFVQFDFPFDFAQGEPLEFGPFDSAQGPVSQNAPEVDERTPLAEQPLPVAERSRTVAERSRTVAERSRTVAERSRGYKSSGGKMVYNKVLKREIPEGWEVKKLNDIIEVKDGTHDSPKYITEGGYPLVTSKNLKKSGIDFTETNKISQLDFDAVNQRSKVDNGDILFSMIGNIGTIYKVEEEINFAIKNVALFKTSKNLDLKNFLYQYLHSYDMECYLPNVISGSIQKFVGLGALRNTPILYNVNIIDAFNRETQPIYSKRNLNVKQNQELAQLRDWLLPMLMNGQVTVGAAEEMVIVAEEKTGYNRTLTECKRL